MRRSVLHVLMNERGLDCEPFSRGNDRHDCNLEGLVNEMTRLPVRVGLSAAQLAASLSGQGYFPGGLKIPEPYPSPYDSAL